MLLIFLLLAEENKQHNKLQQQLQYNISLAYLQKNMVQ